MLWVVLSNTFTYTCTWPKNMPLICPFASVAHTQRLSYFTGMKEITFLYINEKVRKGRTYGSAVFRLSHLHSPPHHHIPSALKYTPRHSDTGTGPPHKSLGLREHNKPA